MKLLRLIKMCITETCSRVRLRKYLPDKFPVRNGLQQDVLSPFFSTVGPPVLSIGRGEVKELRLSILRPGGHHDSKHYFLA